MKKTIVPLIAVLMASASVAEDVTFESLQQAFQKQALSLVGQTNASAMDLQSKVIRVTSRQATERIFGSCLYIYTIDRFLQMNVNDSPFMQVI